MRQPTKWHAVAWVMAGFIAGLPAARAADGLDGLLACRAIADSQERLACFDRAAASLGGGGSPTPAGQAPAVQAPIAAAPARPPVQHAPPSGVSDPKQSFGLSEAAIAQQEVAAGTRPAPLTRIEAHVRALSSAADGRLVFTLDNGQTWVQLRPEGDDLLAKVGDAVTVSRGALGSYWLALSSRRGCKVTRLH